MAVDKNSYLPKHQEKFTVHAHDAIVMILLGLARKNVNLSVEFNSGADLLLSVVLDVDPENDVVYFDVSANEKLNHRLLFSREANFLAIYDGAVVQWASTGVSSDEIDGRRAFRVTIPKKLHYVQRRDSYRVDTPIANPVICLMPMTDGREVSLRLVDICVGGISVILPSDPEPAIKESAEFQNCRITHHDLGIVTVTLIARSFWEVTLKNGNKSRRAGLEFVDLRAETQSMIQRFVYRLERRLIATTKVKDRICA